MQIAIFIVFRHARVKTRNFSRIRESPFFIQVILWQNIPLLLAKRAPFPNLFLDLPKMPRPINFLSLTKVIFKQI